jgi:hypothetical protein
MGSFMVVRPNRKRLSALPPAPFSVCHLLVSPHCRGVDHQLLVAAVGGQSLERLCTLFQRP